MLPTASTAPGRTSPVRRKLSLLVLGAMSVAGSWPAPAAEKWRSVSPAELAEKTPRLEPNAPAEIVFVDLEVDDRGFPNARKVTQYCRYKIFVPSQAESITRTLLVESTASSRRTELSARLVLPDGRTQEFGRESIREQTVARPGGGPRVLEWLLGPPPELREKFLAISGVEPGAVLDYRAMWTTSDPDAVETFAPQNAGVPIRRFHFVNRTFEDPQWINRLFGFNVRGAQFQRDDGRRQVTLSVADLPTLRREPFLGPLADSSLIIKSCYERVHRIVPLRGGRYSAPITIDPTVGPWASHATVLDWYFTDHTVLTARTRKLAAEITRDAADDLARARAVHRHVTMMSQKYRRRPGPHPKATESAESLDDVLDVETKPTIKRPPEEFLSLAIALYRAAGFECRAVMLPDRSQVRFDQREVGRTFLPDRAAVVRIGGEWRFSCPQDSRALPFGLLPWENEGEVALLGIERSAQFIPVPPPPPGESVAKTDGNFAVTDDGTLTGEVRRTFTGHTAVGLRSRLRSANTKQKRAAVVAENLGLNPKVVTVTVDKVSGVEDAEVPLAYTCQVRWPGYAALTKDRLILRGAVLQGDDATPFPATERRHPVQFPFCWQSHDRLAIRLPAGFSPESATTPPPLAGAALAYGVRARFEPGQQTLRVERDFTSNVIDVAPEEYARLKACYDHVARGDQHEMVFVRSGSARASGGND